MRRFAGGVTLVMVMMAGACGGDPPGESRQPATGNAEELKALEAQRRKSPADAIPGLEAYVAKYPADARAHYLLGGALADARPLLASEYTDADRAALERAARHERQALELTTDPEIREAANYLLAANIYGPLKLNRAEDVIEPAKQLIAMSEFPGDAHLMLANALLELKRPDEAVEVWVDAEKTLRGHHRRVIAAYIDLFVRYQPELTDAQIQRLVTVLAAAAADGDNPDPRARAVALTLRAERLEKDPAVRRALLEQAVPWSALADEQDRKSMEELKAAIAELERRAAAGRD